jgi:hypothetical protein
MKSFRTRRFTPAAALRRNFVAGPVQDIADFSAKIEGLALFGR